MSAQTADFQAGMESAESGLSDVERTAATAAAALQVLQGRADETGDEMRDVGRDSLIASGGLSSAASNALGAEISFGSLSVVTATTLVPALVTLSAALAPVVAALGGLAAIGAAIGGVGLISAIGAIATNTEQLKPQFEDLLSLIRDEFAPVFDRAAIILSALISEFAAIVPALVPADDVIQEIGNSFFALGQEIITALPALTELAVELTSEFLPALVSLMDQFAEGLPGAIENFVSIFRRVQPLFVDFGRALGRLLPAFTEFGFTALRVLTPALGALGGALLDVLEFVNDLGDGWGNLAAKVSLAAPIIATVASLFSGPLALALAGIVGAVIGFKEAWDRNLGEIRTFLTGWWEQIKSVFPAARQAFNSFIDGVDLSSIISEAREFADIYGNQLLQVLEDSQPIFDRLKQFFVDNQEEFEILGGVINDLVTGFFNLASVLIQGLAPAFDRIIVPTILTVIDILDGALTRVTEFITALGQIQEGNFQTAIETVTRVDFEEEARRFREFRQGEGPNPTLEDIRIEVVGDTDVVRDVAVEEIQNEERQSRRTSGRNTTP